MELVLIEIQEIKFSKLVYCTPSLTVNVWGQKNILMTFSLQGKQQIC